MNRVPHASATVVTLSRRNLEGLLRQLDERGGEGAISRFTEHGLLVVRAEEDAAHYGERTPGHSG